MAFRDFFGDPEIRGVLENPGEVRPMGWDLQTGERVRVGQGPCLETRLGDHKLVQLFEDGTLLARARADDSFLAFGPRSGTFEDSPHLNSIALVEFTYNFVWLYQRIARHAQVSPENVQLAARFENAWFGEGRKVKLSLRPGSVHSMMYQFGHSVHEASQNSGRAEVETSYEVLGAHPGRAAYLLLERIYLWFGLTPENIPHVEGEGDQRRIEPASLTARR